MPGPYPRDDHYVYGKPLPLRQPYPAYYNSSWYHRRPPRRYLSDMMWFLDDGAAYTIDNKPADPNDRISRSDKITRILNIETVAVHSLRIKLYGPTEEEDTDLILEIGQMYDIMYVTEGGLKVAHGVLKLIDSTIPDTCVRYIGEFNSTVNTAWIAMDCSTLGHSDKRKIYIASIRGIQKVEDENYVPMEVDASDLTDSQKLDTLVDYIPTLDHKIDQHIADEAAHHAEEADQFAQLMAKLGEMPYDDKVNYLYDKMMGMYGELGEGEEVDQKSVPGKIKTIDEKIDFMIDYIKGHNMTADLVFQEIYDESNTHTNVQDSETGEIIHPDQPTIPLEEPDINTDD